MAMLIGTNMRQTIDGRYIEVAYEGGNGSTVVLYLGVHEYRLDSRTAQRIGEYLLEAARETQPPTGDQP